MAAEWMALGGGTSSTLRGGQRGVERGKIFFTHRNGPTPCPMPSDIPRTHPRHPRMRTTTRKRLRRRGRSIDGEERGCSTSGQSRGLGIGQMGRGNVT